MWPLAGEQGKEGGKYKKEILHCVQNDRLFFQRGFYDKMPEFVVHLAVFGERRFGQLMHGVGPGIKSD